MENTQAGSADARIEFRVSIVGADGRCQEVIERHADAMQAATANITRTQPGERIKVSPLVETTRLHGKVRYPHPLHVDATDEAREGWQRARAEREFAAADHHALRLQVQHQDLATQVCMGFQA